MPKILLQYFTHKIKLTLGYCLNKIFTVFCMIKKRATLSLAYQLLKWCHFPHNKWGHHLVRTDRVYVLFISNPIYFPNMIEYIGSVICKCVKDIILSKVTIIHFKCVFKVKIFGLLKNNLLESTNTTHWHLNTHHYLKDKVKILVTEKYFFIILSGFLDWTDNLFLILVISFIFFRRFIYTTLSFWTFWSHFVLFLVLLFLNFCEYFNKLLMHFVINLFSFVNNFF